MASKYFQVAVLFALAAAGCSGASAPGKGELKRWVFSPDVLPEGVRLGKDCESCKMPYWTANPQLSARRNFVDPLARAVFGKDFDVRTVTEALAVLYYTDEQTEIVIFGFLLADDAAAFAAAAAAGDIVGSPVAKDVCPSLLMGRGTAVVVMVRGQGVTDATWAAMKKLCFR